MEKEIKKFNKDNLNVRVYSEEALMGRSAAFFAAERLRKAISEKGFACLILGTGTSQYSFLGALKEELLEWDKITVFHLDEYRGLPEAHPASFRRYLRERILDDVRPGRVFLIDGNAADLRGEIAGYERLLRENPVDIACIGIGENGHIAFNDPPVADFNDTAWVKEVELDHACRMQQLGEGWFPSLDDVPEKAVTLTIPAIMSSLAISCVVPGSRKARAVNDTLHGEISESCPASVLRRHRDATLFLDKESFAYGV